MSDSSTLKTRFGVIKRPWPCDGPPTPPPSQKRAGWVRGLLGALAKQFPRNNREQPKENYEQM